MCVVVPCKYGKDPIENSKDNAWTPFSHNKSITIFFKRSRADTHPLNGQFVHRPSESYI